MKLQNLNQVKFAELVDSAIFVICGWLLRVARKSCGLPRSRALARNDGVKIRHCEALQMSKQSKKIKMDCHADSANLLAMTDFNGLPRESCGFAHNDEKL